MRNGIEKYIAELLYRHDCVIIPGFGGFIGNYSPASVNQVHHTLFPPFKTLLFNIHLKQNDGLLATSIARGENIPYDMALTEIGIGVEKWKKTLDSEGELELEKIGRIWLGSEDTIRFGQDLSVNYLPDAFGLTSLISPAIRRQEAAPAPQILPDAEPVNEPENTFMTARPLKWAAMIALPVGLAFYMSLTNMDHIKNLQENYSGFFFNGTVSHTKPALPAATPHPSHLTPRTANFVPPTSNPAPQTSHIPPPTSHSALRTSPKPWAIIVGAFRLKENADNMVVKLQEQGFANSGIYDCTISGLYRVCIESFSERDEATTLLAGLHSGQYSSAWLLSK